MSTDRVESVVNEDPAAGAPSSIADSSALTVNDRAGRITEALQVYDRAAWLLATVYSPNYYANAIGKESRGEVEDFNHFLSTGVHSQISPSPLIDVKHLEAYEELSLLEWAREGIDKQIVPNGWFDNAFYIQRYADLKDSVDWGFHHFACGGYQADRLPSPIVEHFVNQLLNEFPDESPSFSALSEKVPYGCLPQVLSGECQAALRKLFMAELYKAQIPTLAGASDDAAFSHFLFLGHENTARPSALFHLKTYINNLNGWLEERTTVSSNESFLKPSNDDPRLATLPEESWPLGSSDPWLHWFLLGRVMGVIPTPLFDADFYLTLHPELNAQVTNTAFEHYVFTGAFEPWRQASAFFSASEYRYAASELVHETAILDYVLIGQQNRIRPVNGFNVDAQVSENPFLESAAEIAAIQMSEKIDRLQHGVLGDMVEKAKALDPMLSQSQGPKNIRFAPKLHPEMDLMRVAERIRRDLPKAHYESVVLIPHCRMAGSARIAGTFTKTLVNLTRAENVLLLTTDLNVFDRPDWFPEGIDVFNVSDYFDTLGMEQRARVLLDIVRGVQPSRLFNINSNLGWRMTSAYCRQLSEWMDIYFYLFCWDKDEAGNKTGYPIEWFLPTFDHCAGVFTDSDVLANELRDRYCPTPSLKAKITTLHTPADDPQVSYNDVLTHRSSLPTTSPRLFWSGRFDRQKRVDILCEVARRLPHVEFWVWGKSVIENDNSWLDSDIKNIRLMGSYTHIDEVPIAACDGFLYTAAWDGLPTVLIEVGSRGVPVIASAVGGVVDLIQEHTGTPVTDAEDPNAYVQSIEDLLNDYPAALVKAQALREHTLALCNYDLYQERVNAVINRCEVDL